MSSRITFSNEPTVKDRLKPTKTMFSYLLQYGWAKGQGAKCKGKERRILGEQKRLN
jgi:hypothetical protein